MRLVRNGHTALLIFFTAAPAAFAAEIAIDGVLACRQEANAERRLACYDREAERLDPAAKPATPEDRFGRPAFERKELVRREQETRSLEELKATVTGISRRADGLLTMTLDNGQGWAQKRPDTAFRVAIGDTVRIEPASMGSFLMSSPEKRSTRVTRLK